MTTGNDGRGELGAFLATRRAKITPQQAGLPNYGGRRRVPGLRREEVALLAGISIEYYTRIERGSVRGVSDDVLDALARALQLDDVERAHLIDLVHVANARPRGGRRGAARDQVRLPRGNAQGSGRQLPTADAEPRRRNAVTAANRARALIPPRRNPHGRNHR